ncbi:MAG: ATP-dependent DNA helicase RecG [Planctomycetaceae bacterium]|nr:ATP-dependent DNA helicase RecG [Planctomycetaceae bacterium]MBP61978.1 ATP-dependent DNA helicase RecG [Planctomycetaceae bacterium]
MSSKHDTKAAGLQPNTPVQFIPGVGPQRATLFQKLGLQFARDLLFYFPREYEDMSQLRKVEQFEENVPLSVCGNVEEVDLHHTGTGRTVLGVLVQQEGRYVRALWFNQPYMRDRFSQGQRVVLSGKAKLNSGHWEMAHPRVETLTADQMVPAGQILPLYSLTEGISQGQMRRIIQSVLDSCLEQIDEVFPDTFLQRHNLLALRSALPQVHSPATRELLEQARYRLIYQELLVLQLAVGLRRQMLAGDFQAPQMQVTARIDARIRRLLPFDLTDSQNQAVQEIAGDLNRTTPMNRLLQGDVGSGKTVVAVYAMLAAVAHGRQAVLMTPTEILARQHYATLQHLLEKSQVRIGLLTGTLHQSARQTLQQNMASGGVDLVVGTQALLHAGIEFAQLGLVVVDEQHKFGVEQRAELRSAARAPHYLVMTATPIPRTISMTVFGDLDVTTLRGSPPGRQEVHTYLGFEHQRGKWWDFFRRKLREGRQGYVITPRVEDKGSVRGKSVEEALEELANGELEAFRLDLVHGRMSGEEKAAALNAFHCGQTQVLVATSVVEVGIDVPNATLMTIENGNYFGLSQLHQLRGRVSRGNHPGYVCVFADSTTHESPERLTAFSETTDGFELSEIDFRLRGPGDLFSTKQHGLPPLRIADLVRDTETLEVARRDARQLLEKDTQLNDPMYSKLRRMVLTRYGDSLQFSDVG